MKFGFRTPSIKKRIAARTSFKRYLRHNLGFKAPKGGGWITNPKKAVYNRIYHRTTIDPVKFLLGNKPKKRKISANTVINPQEKKSNSDLLINIKFSFIVVICAILFGSCITANKRESQKLEAKAEIVNQIAPQKTSKIIAPQEEVEFVPLPYKEMPKTPEQQIRKEMLKTPEQQIREAREAQGEQFIDDKQAKQAYQQIYTQDKGWNQPHQIPKNDTMTTQYNSYPIESGTSKCYVSPHRRKNGTYVNGYYRKC